MNIAELIERLEKATGPDRDLDYEIWCALNPDCDPYDYNGGYRWRSYTASLDAALTLVPEGWIWDVASSGAAWVMPDGNLDGQIVIGGIRSPALALCIAALKARQARTCR